MSNINVTNVKGRTSGVAPVFPDGINVSVGQTALIYGDLEVSGISTFNGAGLNVTGVTTSTSTIVGAAVTTDSQGIRAAGIVTATSFTGDGGNLTGLNIPPGTDWVEVSLF